MSTHVTASLIIKRTEFDIDLEVEGSVEPIVHGYYSGPPERCFPDEGGDVEIETVKCRGCGQAVELTPEEQRLAEDTLYKEAAKEWEIAAEDAAMSRYEGSLW